MYLFLCSDVYLIRILPASDFGSYVERREQTDNLTINGIGGKKNFSDTSVNFVRKHGSEI